VVDLLSTVVLARILLPADFGLVALATAISGYLEMVSQFGIELALIRFRGTDRALYDTAWTLSILRGALIGIVIVVICVPVSDFWGDGRLVHILLVLSVASLFSGFRNVGVIDFVKNLEFNKEVVVVAVEKISAFVFAVSVAIIFRSYWALVIGILAGKCGDLLASYAMSSYRPRLSFARLRDVLGFGFWTLVTSVAGYFGHKGPTFFLGKMLDAHAVGVFNIAYQVANVATTELMAPIRRAIFPAYAQISDEPDRLRSAFFKVLSIIMVTTSPVAVGIGLVAEPLVVVVLGERWREAVPVIEIMAVFALLQVSVSASEGVYLAAGRVNIIGWLTIFSGVISVPVFYFGILHRGVVGAGLGMVSVAVCYVLIDFAIAVRLLRLRLLSLVQPLWRSGVALCLMIVSVRTFQDIIVRTAETPRALAVLLGSVVVGAAVYSASLFLLWWLSGAPDGAERWILDYGLETLTRLKSRRAKNPSGIL